MSRTVLASASMDQQIWEWTLTKGAIAPCFVRDIFAMRPHPNGGVDFSWLGHTPCRTVLLVGIVVGVQVYDKRSLYTIDDGTAVIDCILRHPPPEPKPRSPLRNNTAPYVKPASRLPSPKKPRPDRTKESMEPPPPIAEPGHHVRVIGRFVRHYETKQIYADTINPCSSADEIAHLERVINLHREKYSLAVRFVLPLRPWGTTPPDTLTRNDTSANVFSDPSRRNLGSTSYSLPPPPMPIPPQNRSRPSSVSTYAHFEHSQFPSSPTTASVASSTPSSPCKPHSPAKAREAPCKPKLRHPSRLHTRDLTVNTFRLYIKHYMDNAPPSRSGCEESLATPTKHARDEKHDEPTPRPRLNRGNEGADDQDGPTLGFTLSHLRRVPELALLAARVVRAESRKRDQREREKDRVTSQCTTGSARPKVCREGTEAMGDLSRKKIRRLFAWAVVKLYEEGSIVLWDGEVRSLPVPPPPVFEGGGDSRLWNMHDTQGTFGNKSVPCSRSYVPSISGDAFSTMSTTSASVLYTSSASAFLYSDYHPPRRSAKRRPEDKPGQAEAASEVDVVDEDADTGNLSDPGIDEEAYVPLTARLLAGHVKEAMGALRRGQGRDGDSARPAEPTPEDISRYLQRTDGRWARVGAWAVEGALSVLKTE